MPTFEYQAQGADGQVVTGRVFGVSIDQALQELAGKGLQIQQIGLAANPNDPLASAPMASPANRPAAVQERPVRAAVEAPATVEGPEQDYAYATSVVNPAGYHSGPPVNERSYMETSVWGPLVGQVPLSAVHFFFRQGATMFAAGVPIVQALETLSGQSSSAKLTGIIREMAGHVKEGRQMSVALQRYPEVFSPVVVSLIRAGEEGGFLDEAMDVVAEYVKREMELRNLYKRVTFMPKLQVAFSIIIVIAANLIIDSIGGSEKLYSPLTNPLTWVWLGPLIVGLFLFFRVGLANPRIKYVWDGIINKTPYLGTTMRQFTMAKFGRAFGALYKGGVPMQKALRLSADACGNEALRSRMYGAYSGLESGRGVTESFRETEAFSPIVLDMVNTGEQTGNLDQMLNKMADYYEDEAAVRAVKTGQVTGVLLGLAVAIYIGYIVINFWVNHYGGLAGAANG